MPRRNLCRLYIHLAFTYSVGLSNEVWSEIGPAQPFPTNESAWSIMVTRSQSHVWSGSKTIIAFHLHWNIWQYSTKYFQRIPHLDWSEKYTGIFGGILLVPHNIVMDRNNIMVPRALAKSFFQFLKMLLVGHFTPKNHEIMGYHFILWFRNLGMTTKYKYFIRYQSEYSLLYSMIYRSPHLPFCWLLQPKWLTSLGVGFLIQCTNSVSVKRGIILRY